MKKLLLFTIILSSTAVSANNGDRYAEGEMDDAQTEMVKQRMETVEKDKPSSTSVGGSRSGQLDFEKREDAEQMRQEQEEKEAHDFEKQKQLYEYDEQYRRGL
jgi:hypothetical protein